MGIYVMYIDIYNIITLVVISYNQFIIVLPKKFFMFKKNKSVTPFFIQENCLTFFLHLAKQKMHILIGLYSSTQ